MKRRWFDLAHPKDEPDTSPKDACEIVSSVFAKAGIEVKNE